MKLELCSYPTASAISLMRRWLRVKRSAAFCILFSLSEWLRLSSSANSSIVQGGLDAIIPRILWTRSSYAVGIDISGGAGCACDLRAFEEFDLLRFFFDVMMRQFQSDTKNLLPLSIQGLCLGLRMRSGENAQSSPRSKRRAVDHAVACGIKCRKT